MEGKKKQVNGNAVERAGKNLIACHILFGNEDICPFISWFQGCDFYYNESNIVDRVRTMFLFQKNCELHLYWKPIMKNLSAGGSYFMRGHSMNEAPGTSDWTFDEMLPVMLQTAKDSVEYYKKTYGGK